MDLDPQCPVCASRDWDRLGTRIYRKSEESRLAEYVRIRYEILFDVWLPGQEQAEFASILCRKCGFLTFEPRPDGEDMARKYRYLSGHESARHEAMSHIEVDRKRSGELFDRLAGYFPGRPALILDYGGGSGGLMQAFVEAGHECSVVDYVEATVPGVRRLGSTLDDIAETWKFDIIVCSHVLEHLQNFVEVVRRLSEHLSEAGIIYVEVPLEVWDGIPLPAEPVTHINFFTPRSLKLAMEHSGLKVLTCAEEICTFEGGARALAAMAVSQRIPAGQDMVPDFGGAAEESRRLISPSLYLKWRRFSGYPEFRKRTINAWGRRYLPRAFFWRFFD